MRTVLGDIWNHWSMPLLKLPLPFDLFLIGERERACEREGQRQTETETGTERENLKRAPLSVHSPTPGSIPRPWGHDLGGNQESDASPRGAPQAAPTARLVRRRGQRIPLPALTCTPKHPSVLPSSTGEPSRTSLTAFTQDTGLVRNPQICVLPPRPQEGKP